MLLMQVANVSLHVFLHKQLLEWNPRKTALWSQMEMFWSLQNVKPVTLSSQIQQFSSTSVISLLANLLTPSKKFKLLKIGPRKGKEYQGEGESESMIL